jgi:hypothetical protein
MTMAVSEHDENAGAPAGIDLTVASPARIYDYFLDGKDNFSVDRQVGDEVIARIPEAKPALQANRRFLQRAVRLMAEQGIDQFIDLGTGIPTAGPVHEIAQRIHPDAHVVYVDNDPIVFTHNQALLRADNVISIKHDIREPDRILNDPQLLRLIDFARPVGVLFVAVLHFITDAEDPCGIVKRFRERMAPGSHIAVSHDSSEKRDPEVVAAVEEIYEATAPIIFRDYVKIASFFQGFEFVEPGLVHPPDWRPDSQIESGTPGREWLYAGVAKKP